MQDTACRQQQQTSQSYLEREASTALCPRQHRRLQLLLALAGDAPAGQGEEPVLARAGPAAEAPAADQAAAQLAGAARRRAGRQPARILPAASDCADWLVLLQARQQPVRSREARSHAACSHTVARLCRRNQIETHTCSLECELNERHA